MQSNRLKLSLLSLLSESPERISVQYFIEQCFQMAQVYLRRKAMAGRLDPGFFGLSLDDLALDCIADLFERDEAGRFGQLVAYFTPMGPAERTEAALLMATRRLVFSKVSEGLFRRYREADPALARTIRNLRYTVQHLAGVRETRWKGDLWFFFDGEAGEAPGEAASAPLMAPELLEARLTAVIEAGTSLQQIVNAVRRILLDQPAYAPAYPLVGLARIVQSAFERLADAPQPDHVSTDNLYAEDIRAFIESCTQTIKADLAPKYVARRKIDAGTFDAYFNAVRDILHAQCVVETSASQSYYDHLRPYATNLSYEVYRQDHRARFEYIVKQTREHFLTEIARHW